MAGPGAKQQSDVQPKLRLDKWLFQARFFRNRETACTMIEKGHLRINGQKCKKPGHGVMVGDTLTFVQAQEVRLIRVLALSERRGPATEAQTLYLDLDAPPLESPA